MTTARTRGGGREREERGEGRGRERGREGGRGRWGKERKTLVSRNKNKTRTT